MKFPKFQYDRILKIIESNEFELEEFFLVKRKGWIRIEHLQSGKFYTYFKKKETILSERGQWEFKVAFKVKMDNKKEQVVPTFDSMMELLNNWIKDLK